MFKRKQYQVTFLAVGMMGNTYEAGVFVVSPTRKQLKEFGSVHIYAFQKNRKKLIRHYTNAKTYTANVKVIEESAVWSFSVPSWLTLYKQR